MIFFQYNIECSGKGGIPEPQLLAVVGKSSLSFNEQDNTNLEPLENSILQNPETGEKTYSKVTNG